MQLHPFMIDPYLFARHLDPQNAFFICRHTYDTDLLLRIYHDAVSEVKLRDFFSPVYNLFLTDLRRIFFPKRHVVLCGFLLPHISFRQTVRTFCAIRRGRSRPQHPIRHTKPSGNIKCTALSGLSDDHPIERAQTFPVKGHSRIDDTLFLLRILFYFRIMRRHKKQRAAFFQFFENGDRYSHPFRRVRSRAEFIHYDKTVTIYLMQDIKYIGDMRGKRGKILRQILSIADIAQKITVHADLRFHTGYMQTALCHQGV